MIKKKSRIYILSAFDEETPYLVPTQYESFSGVGGKSFSNVLRYQNFINSNSQIGFLASNRFYEGDGYGNLFGVDALFNFSNVWKFELELFLNNNKEPNSNIIEINKKFGNKTVALDGENIKGSAVFASIRRDTENWRTRIEYKELSDGFRSDLGFITTNDLRQYSVRQGFYKFPNKDLLKNYSLVFSQDFRYNQLNEISRSNFQTYFSVLTILNTSITHNYEYNFYKSYLEFQFKNFINHWVRVESQPFDFLNLQVFYKFGKDIAYREEIPKLGYTNDIRFTAQLSLTDNLRITPTINYSSIKKNDGDGYFFKGYIGRLDLRYQFTNTFDLRVISEYNDFSKQFFFQPLISWRPNPDTIFYVGGNQNYIDQFIDYNSPHYKVNRTQLFLKFQYLIK